MNKIKLIWEYKGPNANGIAEHQVIHLTEYCLKNKIEKVSTGIEKFQNNTWFAYLILLEDRHAEVAKELKPRFLQKLQD